MASIKEFRDEISEWEELKKCAKKQKILNQIDAHINTLREQLYRLESQATPQKVEEIKTVQNANHKNAQKKDDFLPIQQFAWDQESDKITIYVTLKGIHNISDENIQVNFSTNTFDIKIYDLGGKNYRMHIAKLCNLIVPSKSTFKVKKDAISIKLIKDGYKHWEQLQFKETLKPKAAEPSESSDPAASLMNLMKNLYQDGDDEMKRTIAKAWTEAQDKKHRSNPFGMDNQFDC